MTGREGMGRGGRGITAGLSQQATSPDEHKMGSGKRAALPSQHRSWALCSVAGMPVLAAKQFTYPRSLS